MTSVEVTPTQAGRPAVFVSGQRPGRVTQTRLIRSEWIKLRTLRSSWVTFLLGFLALVVVGIAVGVLTNQDWSHMRPGRQQNFDPIDASLTGVTFAQLAFGVLGVLYISGEYGTGSIRSTLAAAPKRLPVLWAKTIVYLTVVLVSSEIGSFLGFFGGQAALGPHGTTISAPGALRATIGVGLYLTVVALIGLALGFLIRSTAGGIAAFVGLLLVLPGILDVLPDSWQTGLGPYLPSNAGSVLWDQHPDPGALSPWVGFAVFVAYGAVALVAAAVVLKRRDA